MISTWIDSDSDGFLRTLAAPSLVLEEGNTSTWSEVGDSFLAPIIASDKGTSKL
jgi:hypothetical protein